MLIKGGIFLESYQAKKFNNAFKKTVNFIQDNHSFSLKKGLFADCIISLLLSLRPS